jgi:hypothetical protein
MPILPEKEEAARAEPLRALATRAAALLTGQAPVTVRLVILLVFAVLGSSMAPIPWNQIALLSIVGIALETVARRR